MRGLLKWILPRATRLCKGDVMTLHKHGGTTRRKSVRKKVPKHLRKKVSAKIHKLKHEGKSQDQAIAQGINQTLSESKKRK